MSCSRYPVVHCRTKNEDFSLNLGLLDFGTAYLFVITNVSSSWPFLLYSSIYLYLYLCNYTISKFIYNLYLSVLTLWQDSITYLRWLMVNNVGFVISEEEDLAVGPGTGLITQELLCSRVLLKWKRDRESFWHRYQKGDRECPPR